MSNFDDFSYFTDKGIRIHYGQTPQQPGLRERITRAKHNVKRRLSYFWKLYKKELRDVDITCRVDGYVKRTYKIQGVDTVATNCETIFYSRKFFESLSDEQLEFALAHAYMHIAFQDISRSRHKNKRLWNIATDAFINRKLKTEYRLPLPPNAIDIDMPSCYTAEAIYEKLLEQQEQEGENSADQQNEQVGHDSHALWERALKELIADERAEREFQKYKKEREKKRAEREEKERREREREEREQKEQKEEREEREEREEKEEKDKKEDDIGESKAVFNWGKKLLQAFEEERWTFRRACKEDGWSSRLEEFEECPEIEVMLDVSGSVDDLMLYEFLGQLKHLFRESRTIKVGCFDTRFYGWEKIRNTKDINSFRFPRGGGTNLDLPVRCFTKHRDINKIIFTDGKSDDMPRDDLKKVKNLVWLIYNNNDFHPCCGKVIYVEKSTFTPQYYRVNKGLGR